MNEETTIIKLDRESIQKKYPKIATYAALFAETNNLSASQKELTVGVWHDLAKLGNNSTSFVLGDLRLRIGHSKFNMPKTEVEDYMNSAYKASSEVMREAFMAGVALPDLKPNLSIYSSIARKVITPTITSEDLKATLEGMPEDKLVTLQPNFVKEHIPTLWEYATISDRITISENSLRIAWGLAMQELLINFQEMNVQISWEDEYSKTTVAGFRQRHYKLQESHPCSRYWKARLTEANALPALRLKELKEKDQLITKISPYVTVKSNALTTE